MTSSEAMLRAALEYSLRWHVFPAPINTKKSHKSKKFSDGREWGRTRDAAEIRRDWARWPDANIGLPCGAINGFWVVETDTRAGGHAHDGEEELAALVAANGPLPDTRRARSPSGSIHYYFKWPDDGGDDIINTAGTTLADGRRTGIANGIDTRGEGGMVIAPPSNRTTGVVGVYEWVNDNDVLPAPDWLVRLAREASAKSRRDRSRGAASTTRDETSYCDVERLAAAMVELANPDLDWETWNKVIMAVYAATGGTSAGLKIARDWSAKSTKHDDAGLDDKWRRLGQSPPTDIGAGYVFARVFDQNPNWDRISRDDFHSHMPSGSYLFTPTMQFWSAKSVDGRLPPIQTTYVDADGNTKVKKIKPHTWLDQNRPIDQATWLPGKPGVIEHKLLSNEGVWVDRRGAKAFNFYRAPTLIPGDARLAGPWLDVVDRVVGDDRRHILAWFAHRVQRPWEKINHALVIGGAPGIGKDSMIEPLRRAIGANNFAEVDPPRMIGRFNKFLQAVVLRVSEARDLGDVNRYAFYEHLKLYTASPPDVLVVEEKYQPAYPIANVVCLIITTNYKDGLYLPPDDRRTHVSWSDANAEDIGDRFFTEYWEWLNAGGDGHVLAYLRDLDLARFNAKAPPPKTAAFWETVSANATPETNDVANVIEANMDSPDAFNIVEFFNAIPLDSDLRDWAAKNRKNLGRRFAEAGYVSIPNPATNDGVWRINRRRTVIYGKVGLSRREQVDAARRYVSRAEEQVAETHH